jgi:hypothetical protein
MTSHARLEELIDEAQSAWTDLARRGTVRTTTLDDLFREEEAKAEAGREPAPTPLTGDALVAYERAAEERAAAHHAKGVRCGWWNENGDPIEDENEYYEVDENGDPITDDEPGEQENG